MGVDAHRQGAPPRITAYVVTLSDSRRPENDTTGALIRESLQAAGHAVMGWCILREEPEVLRRGLEQLLDRGDLDVLVLSGGTGIAPRDHTYDVLTTLYEQEIPGFGELFRALSYAEIGSAAMLSRASAGVSRRKLLFSLPGSTAAARLALEKLILPELGHLVGELRRPSQQERPS